MKATLFNGKLKIWDVIGFVFLVKVLELMVPQYTIYHPGMNTLTIYTVRYLPALTLNFGKREYSSNHTPVFCLFWGFFWINMT